MINKISKLKDFGIFHHFSWMKELPEFKKFNLLYGWNRSGKTTISRVFTSCERKCVYDKEKFESIIYTFDDDYDMLKDFISNLNPVIKSHKELLKVSDNILSNLIQAQNDLGIVISQHENKRV